MQNRHLNQTLSTVLILEDILAEYKATIAAIAATAATAAEAVVLAGPNPLHRVLDPYAR